MALYSFIVYITAAVMVINGIHTSPHVNCSYGVDNMSTVVPVNSSNQLESVLNCIAGNDEVKEVEVVLDHKTKGYELLWEDFIYFNRKDITIRSSSAEDRVTLDCNSSNGSVSNGGLTFVNSSVTLVNLHFVSCGANLSQLPHRIVEVLLKIDSTFPENNATILLISSMLNLTGVYIEASKGFSISAINLLTTSSFEHMKVYNSVRISEKYVNGLGGGVFLFFSDDPAQTIPTHGNITVSMRRTKFEKNINLGTKGHCLLNSPITSKMVYYAAGLTVKYTQKNCYVNLLIDEGHFYENIGENSGAILVINHEKVSATTIVQNSIFERNGIQECYGKDLVLLHLGGVFQHRGLGARLYPLIMKNSNFSGALNHSIANHIQATNAIAVGVYASNISMHFYFKNLRFNHHSTPQFDGTCLLFEQLFETLSKISKPEEIRVTMESISAKNNAKNYLNDYLSKSLFYYKQISNVTFSGNGVFENNFGSVIHADGTNLCLNGNMTFINNTAKKGAAINIHGNVQLYFMPGLQQASFINNRAYYIGGAIYAKCGTSFTRTKCALQFILGKPKIKFAFNNNVAKVAGNSIYATPISNCQIGLIYRTKRPWLPKYLKYFNLSSEHDTGNHRLPLSTSANRLLLSYTHDDGYKHSLETFPGQKLQFYSSAQDLNKRNVFSYLSMEIFVNENKDRSRKHLWIQQHQSAGGNVLLEQEHATNISFTIHTNSSECLETKLVLSIPDGSDNTYYITLKPCPLGFSIYQSAGVCYCSYLVKHYLPNIWCDINRKTIERTKYLNTWIGLMNDGNTIVEALSLYCPYLYCDRNPQYHYLRSTDNGFLLSNASGLNGILICMNHRTGVLCGRCDTSNNYSLVFGSSECKQCSNLWLVTIIGYSIIGPLLVFILYALRLTIALGTLNGAIFYVQAANAGLIDYMTTPYTETVLNSINHVYRSIFLFLNLNLGVPLCFYNGMDQLWKTGLGLVFPVYLLLIVVCVIIISRYSTWVSNRTAHLSVQVLVTVVHLSFSKLLATLFEVYTPATVHTADPDNSSHLVWYWDGSIDYLGTSHLLLTAITTAIVLLLLIPYIGLFAFGRRIMKCSKWASLYLRPVIETAYAPYKEGKQDWFVLRLILRIILYILYVIFRTRTKTILNISMTATLASFTVMKAFSRPYKNNAISVVDCWLMVNITIVYTTLWSPTQSTATLVFNTILVSLGLLTIGGILLYHILRVTKYRNIITNNLIKGKKYIPLVRCHHHHGNDPAGQPIGQRGSSGSRGISRGYCQFMDSSCEHVYREPLLMEQ